jgi:hypothetical protein
MAKKKLKKRSKSTKDNKRVTRDDFDDVRGEPNETPIEDMDGSKMSRQPLRENLPIDNGKERRRRKKSSLNHDDRSSNIHLESHVSEVRLDEDDDDDGFTKIPKRRRDEEGGDSESELPEQPRRKKKSSRRPPTDDDVSVN